MANLKEIRTRISSVKSTQQITSAMKMVSASRLRKAQNAITDMRPYSVKLLEILTRLAASLDDISDNKYMRTSEGGRILLVLVSSNRGLCGAFNSNVVKAALELCDCRFGKKFSESKVDFIAIGKKCADLLHSKDIAVSCSFNAIYDDLSFGGVSKVADEIINQFVDKTYDEIHLVYNEFKNASVQILRAEQFLPLKIGSDVEQDNSDYIVEPSEIAVVEKMIPFALKTQFFKAILESYASEHGARMTAMHKATDNAADLIRELRLNYNKARQAAITNEILEIVSGAEALKN